MLTHQELITFNKIFHASNGRGLTAINESLETTHYITLEDLQQEQEESENLEMLLILVKTYDPENYYIRMIATEDSIKSLEVIKF
jgi:hypothetical protein